MNILIIEPGKYPRKAVVSNTLSSLQEIVGGYIQAVYPYDEPVAIICDEEAKLKGSELNRVLRDEDGNIYDVVAGTFLIVGLGEEDFTSLTPEHMKQFKEKFVHTLPLLMAVYQLFKLRCLLLAYCLSA